MFQRWRSGSTWSWRHEGARLGLGVLAILVAVGCVQSYSSKVRSRAAALASQAAPPASTPPPAPPPPPAAVAPAAPPEQALTEAQRAALVTTRKPLPTAPLGFTLGGTQEEFETACRKLGGWPTGKGDVVSCRGPNQPDFKAESVEGRFCDGKLCVVTGVPADKTLARATKVHTTIEQEYGPWVATTPEAECAVMKEQTYVHHFAWFDPSAPADARITGSIEVRFACQKAGEMPVPSLIVRDAAGQRAHGKLTAEELR